MSMMATVILAQGLVDRVWKLAELDEQEARYREGLFITEKEWPDDLRPEVEELIREIGSVNAELNQYVIFGGVEAPAYRRVHGEGRAVRMRHAPLWVSSRHPGRLAARRFQAFEKLAELANDACSEYEARRQELLGEAKALLKRLGVDLITDANVFAVAELARAELTAMYAKADIGDKS